MADDTQDIRDGLRGQFHRLALELCPGGARDGNHYKPLNPVRADRRPGSFVLDVDGPSKGRWTEFALSGAGGKYLGGDPIDLIAYIIYGGPDAASRAKAFAWARSWLGLTRDSAPTPAERDQARLDSARAAKQAAADDRARRNASARRAAQWWIGLGAQSTIAGTLGERYLRDHRAIRFDVLGRYPRAVRFAPDLKAPGSDVRWPGLLTAMVRYGEGRICAVHRTLLDPVTGDKAAIENARFAYGDLRGAAMRLWKGPYEGGGSLEKAFASTGELAILQVHEGLEDALSWAMVRPERVHWAMYSLSNLANLEWPEFADEVVVTFDRDIRPDDTKYNRERAADRQRVIDAVSSQARGRVFQWLMPRGDKDSNDIARQVL